MIKKTTFILLTIFLISGCATNTGHQFLAKMSNEEIASKLIQNQTSKSEVLAMFGDPEDIEIDNDGGETLLYQYIRSEAKSVNYVPIASAFYAGTNDNKRKLKIKLNSKGIVERFAFSSSHGETKFGLFQ